MPNFHDRTSRLIPQALPNGPATKKTNTCQNTTSSHHIAPPKRRMCDATLRWSPRRHGHHRLHRLHRLLGLHRLHASCRERENAKGPHRAQGAPNEPRPKGPQGPNRGPPQGTTGPGTTGTASEKGPARGKDCERSRLPSQAVKRSHARQH